MPVGSIDSPVGAFSVLLEGVAVRQFCKFASDRISHTVTVLSPEFAIYAFVRLGLRAIPLGV